MSTIYLPEWYGRLGNNIIQLLNVITYGLQNNYEIVRFPNHYAFNTTEIVLNKSTNILDPIRTYIAIDESCFYFMIMNNKLSYTINIKELFNKYIKKIFNNIKYDLDINYDLTIYFRSGDIFEGKMNDDYIQPSLSFYQETIKNKANILLVSENLNNPILKLFSYKYLWNQNNIFDDLNLLINSKEIVIGNSVFCLLVLLLSDKNEKIYIADYIYNKFKNIWKIDLNELLNNNQEIIIIKTKENYENEGKQKIKYENSIGFMID
jgi:hypothetical protein